MCSALDTVCRWIFIVYDMQFCGPPETMFEMTYVQRYCTQIYCGSPALLGELDATCHICAHVGKPETTVQYTCSQEAEHPLELM